MVCPQNCRVSRADTKVKINNDRVMTLAFKGENSRLARGDCCANLKSLIPETYIKNNIFLEFIKYFLKIWKIIC